MKQNYVDTDIVQASKERINNFFGMKQYNSVLTNGYDRVYGRISTEIELEILMSDLIETYGNDLYKIFKSGLVYRLVHSSPNLNEIVFKAVFWDNNHTQIIGYIVD